MVSTQQGDAIDGYPQQKIHRTVAVVENCSDADCLFATVLYQLATAPPGYTAK